jgi:cell division protein FtsZ
MADEVLLQAVQGISDVITRPGKVNIDFNDIRKVMCNSKKALVGVGVASGPDRHLIAAKKAINSPLLEDADIRGAKGFVVHFVAEENLTLFEISEVMNLIRQNANNDSVIMYGHAYDSTLNGALKVTVIATGFSAEKAHAFNARRQLDLEAPGEIKMTRAPREDVFADVEQKNEFDDPMMVPAIIRRKKRIN